MLTKIKTIEELKTEFIIALRNNTNLVTKFTSTSVVNAWAYANAKLAQKLNKDIAYVEARLFPEFANSSVLDDISNLNGFPARGLTTQSTVILLFRGNSGTVYNAGFQVRTSSGYIFTTNDNLILGVNGVGYVVATSVDFGEVVNVGANTITVLVSGAPTGHSSVTNLVRAKGGRDVESDFDYRRRLMGIENLLSKNTIAFYESLIQKFEPNVIRIYPVNHNPASGAFTLRILKNNAATFTSNELATLKTNIQQYVPMADSQTSKLNLDNWSFVEIDIVAVVKETGISSLQKIHEDAQINVQNYFNWSTWKNGAKVEWDDLLEIIKNTTGVEKVLDANFLPRKDIEISLGTMPRLRNLVISNVAGSSINQVVSEPIYLTDIDGYYAEVVGV